jgi:hypothetical protein
VPSSPFLPPARLGAASQVIDEAADATGRSPGDVVRVYNIACGPDESGAGFLPGPPSVRPRSTGRLLPRIRNREDRPVTITIERTAPARTLITPELFAMLTARVMTDHDSPSRA